MQNKKAFSFVEIIITIAIIALLAVIGLSSKDGYDENMNNTKVVSDVETINNALSSFKETSELPLPKGNTNFFSTNGMYTHSYDDSTTFGVYGSITEDTLPKSYLDIVPLDPITNSYYSYGKTKYLEEFEIASVMFKDNEPSTKIIGNYAAETGVKNLIREYNGPDFVSDGSKVNFPYNPDELVLIARVEDTPGNWITYREGDIIETNLTEKEIFFSDGSVSILDPNSKIKLTKLQFSGEKNLSTFVKVALGAGKIWTKATHLNEGSEFEVYTTDTTAAVRGTIFSVSKDKVISAPTTTEVIVIEGIVDVYRTEIPDFDFMLDDVTETVKDILKDNIKIETLDVKKGETPKKAIYEKITSSGDISTSGIEEITQPQLYPKEISSVEPQAKPIDIKTPLENTELTIDKEIITDVSIDLPQEICTTFYIGETCQDNENNLNDYKLIAYAPYDYKTNNYSLYSEQGKMFAEYSNLDHAGEITGDNIKKIEGSRHNFYNIDTNGDGIFNGTGILIDNEQAADKLKYDISTLNLGNNFAIEMSVRFPNTNPGITTNFFETDNGYGSYINYAGKTYFKNIFDKGYGYFMFDGKFHTITYIKNGENYSLMFDGVKNNNFDFSSTNNIGTLLYIGSNSNSDDQINTIIDFVKIYTKKSL